MSVYSTRISPSVTRERYFQYVRASRSRCVGVQISTRSPSGIVMSAAWIDRTAPEASIVVCCSGSAITELATCCSRESVEELQSAALTASSKPSGRSLIPSGGRRSTTISDFSPSTSGRTSPVSTGVTSETQ